MQMTLPGERALLGIATDREKDFLEFVQRASGQKRKTLRNNLQDRKLRSENSTKRSRPAAFVPTRAPRQLTSDAVCGSVWRSLGGKTTYALS